MKRVIAFTLFACTALAIIFNTPVSAQDTGGLTVSPINYRTNLSAGQKSVASITISNKEPVAQVLQLVAAEAVIGPDSKLIDIKSLEESQEGIAAWLQIPASQITVPASSSITIEVGVLVADETQEGSYFPTLLIETPPAALSGTAAAVSQSLMFIFSVNVSPSRPTSSIEIINLSVSNPVTTQEVRVDYTFTNRTKLFTRPLARLQILSPEGQRIWQETVNAEYSVLMPGTNVHSTIFLSADELDLSQLGEYKLELLITDQQFETAEIAKASFVVVPTAYLIAAMILILAVSGGFIALLVKLLSKKEVLDLKSKLAGTVGYK